MTRHVYLSAVCVAWAAAAAQAHPDVAELIARYDRTARRYERIAAKVEILDYAPSVFDESDGLIPQDRLAETNSVQIWRDGDRARGFDRLTRREMDRGRLVEHAEPFEWLVTPEVHIMIRRDPATGRFKGPDVLVHYLTPSNHVLRDRVNEIGLRVF